jgi:alpha-mannosidase/mannosylglycerate hydrolase
MNRAKVRALPRHYPQFYRTNDVSVALSLAVPALGYTTLMVREGEMAAKDEIVGAAMLPTRHPSAPGLATSERSMENAMLAVSIESNGTLTLTDKRSGQIYARLLTFEDTADIGDGWYHGQAVNDQAFVSIAAPADVALMANGPLLARFRIRTTMQIPAEFNFDRMARSADLGAMVIDNHVTLRRDSDRVEVETVVHNAIRDHRLRVLFPTGSQTATYLADSAFDVVERPIGLPADNHNRRELAVETCPQQSWTAVADRQRGLAVVAPGLMETAVRDLPDRPLALTLFRATRRTVFTDGEPQGQLEGTLPFKYWILPVHGAVDRVRLSELGIQLGAGVRNFQLPANGFAGVFVPVPATLPPSASFLRVDGGVIVTSTRERDGTLEVRCFNPHPTTVTAAFDFSGRPSPDFAPATAQRVDFEARRVGEPVPITEGRVSLPVRAKEIVTVRFHLRT